MKRIAFKDRRLLAMAVVVGLLLADRVAAWLTGGDGWLTALASGGALLA